MSEIWKPVARHEGRYEVSNNGRVRSLDRTVTYSDGRIALFKGRVLSEARGASGYLTVTLDRGKRALVHRLVAETFLSRPDGATVVNHKNGDKRDNRAENLEWGDYTHNNRHARETGLIKQHGENCNLSRYSDQLVAAIRRVHARYDCTYRELALLFDISEMQAADIVKGRTRAK
ncbi:NUMOD4 domain-containing protein [Microvirga lenta]|uniref:NUMOD4 domain-containing protein n=1 Tax=Microvirga lenta TaxID=2881337 RepID=UPI001CFEEC87|nr:NUMOD4 domain-containing protein [Microvirga lenta]MCB5173631.1 NUMOD4 motif-containing HNH endonuclease [Microvirga lenta]